MSVSKRWLYIRGLRFLAGVAEIGRGKRACMALLVSALLLYGLSGCSGVVFAPPNPLVLKQPPITVQPEQLYQDYTSSYSVTAPSRYSGQRLLLTGLIVEQVMISRARQPENSDFFTVGSLLFKPRYPRELLELGEGTIVDIVGELAGMSGNYIIVVDCWIRVAGGAAPNYPMY